ncbi:MAG: GDP-mannose 4,6-dehydratase, partial [Planctomycetes bacterium]|nr:GDP-mannose 4,6-dehydratase [Planctomycetota bacterium]
LEVHGTDVRPPAPDGEGFPDVAAGIRFHLGDLLDREALEALVRETAPDEVYNLAARSFVPASWADPVETSDVTALGVARILEAVRKAGRPVRFFQASSAELFGRPAEAPQSESTPVRPRTPYGAAKAFGHFLTGVYRQAHGLFACAGILFNHESELRGKDFVTRKITLGAARIRAGLQRELFLGNLDARVDWGFAGDTVEAMWLMLRAEKPDDYVVATGETRSVRDFCRVAFEAAGLRWEDHVRVDPSLVRPAEPVETRGDASKARRVLGWAPKLPFEDLVRRMAEADRIRVGGG